MRPGYGQTRCDRLEASDVGPARSTYTEGAPENVRNLYRGFSQKKSVMARQWNASSLDCVTIVSTTSQFGWSRSQAVILSPRWSRSGAIVAEKTLTPLKGLASPSLRMLFPVLADICNSTSLLWAQRVGAAGPL